MEKQDPQEPTEVVEAVAKALYQTAVASAKEEIESVSFEVGDIEELFVRLTLESEIAQVLIFQSYLDDRMKSLIITHMFHLDSNNVRERLFGISGPLSTFNTRILIAFHLGWLSPSTKKMLDALRQVRNAFGHDFKMTFDHPKIIDLWRSIEIDVEAVMENGSPPDSFPAYRYEELPESRKRLCQLTILAQNVFEDLMVLPRALLHRINPHDIVFNFDDSPQAINKIRMEVARAFLRSIQKEGTVVDSLDDLEDI